MTRISYHQEVGGQIAVAEFDILESGLVKFSVALRASVDNNVVIYRTIGEAKSIQDAETLAESYAKKLFALSISEGHTHG